jgi:hypothetical protein
MKYVCGLLKNKLILSGKSLKMWGGVAQYVDRTCRNKQYCRSWW